MQKEETKKEMTVPFADCCWPAVHALLDDASPSIWDTQCQREGSRKRVFVLANDRRHLTRMFAFYVAANTNLDWIIPWLPPWPKEGTKPRGTMPDNLHVVGIARNQQDLNELMPTLVIVPAATKILWLTGKPQDFNLEVWDIEVAVHYSTDEASRELATSIVEKTKEMMDESN